MNRGAELPADSWCSLFVDWGWRVSGFDEPSFNGKNEQPSAESRHDEPIADACGGRQAGRSSGFAAAGRRRDGEPREGWRGSDRGSSRRPAPFSAGSAVCSAERHVGSDEQGEGKRGRDRGACRRPSFKQGEGKRGRDRGACRRPSFYLSPKGAAAAAAGIAWRDQPHWSGGPRGALIAAVASGGFGNGRRPTRHGVATSGWSPRRAPTRRYTSRSGPGVGGDRFGGRGDSSDPPKAFGSGS